MTEFLKQIPEMWDDSVNPTEKWLDTLIDEWTKEKFKKLVSDLSMSLTSTIDKKWIKDVVVAKIIQSSNDDISELVSNFWNKIWEEFNDFNTEFNQKFAWENLNNYINKVSAWNAFAEKTEWFSWIYRAWVSKKTESEIAKLNL